MRCCACLCHPLALYASLHACLLVHAWVFLASVSSILKHNEVMDIRSKPTFVPREHHLLFIFLLVFFFACLFASLLSMPIVLIRFMLVHMLFASFPSMACLLVSCLYLCMYTHGRGCMELGHSFLGASKRGADVSMWLSQAAVVSRFRCLASPLWLCTLLNHFLPLPFLP